MKLFEALLKLNNLVNDVNTVTNNLESPIDFCFGCEMKPKANNKSIEEDYKVNVSKVKDLLSKYYALQEDVFKALVSNKVNFIGVEMSLLTALTELNVFKFNRGCIEDNVSLCGDNTFPHVPWNSRELTPLNNIVSKLRFIMQEDELNLGKKYFTFHGYEKEKLNVEDKYKADLKILVFEALNNVEI